MSAFPTPLAVAAAPTGPCPPTALADAAGERGHTLRNLAPVDTIEPVDGWVLMTDSPCRNPRFETAEFFARRNGVEVHIDVSRYASNFSFTQARFAWFVANGFPDRPRTGVVPWTNESVDAQINGGAA